MFCYMLHATCRMVFVGNEKIIARLNKAISTDSVAGAYLFSGPRHAGKRTLAEFFAFSLIRGDANLDMESAPSPDVLMDMVMVFPEKEEKKGVVKEKDISVEKIREAQASLALFPYGGKRKALIIDQAHKMGVGAQNALLKTLEEPNPTSVLILVTDEEDRILPTLKSRCQNVVFSLPSDGELAEMVPPSAENRDELLLSALGRPGLMRALLEDDNLRQRRSAMAGRMRGALALSVGAKIALAEDLSKDVSVAIDSLTLLVWILRKEALLEKSAGKTALGYARMGKIEDCIETLKRTNANSRLAIENLLLDL